jgi:ABC-type phosphate transport system permease subunit
MKQYSRCEAKEMQKAISKLDGLIKKNHFRLAAIMGLMLLVIGVSLLGYSLSAIQEREHLLNSANLTPDETWQYEGSLSWWRNAYATMFLPLAVVSMTLGGAALVSQPLWTRMHRESVLDTFADNVKRAAKENYERPKLH